MIYLFVIQIPVVYQNGKYWIERLAAIDILAHRRLLSPSVRLVVAAPVVDRINGSLLLLDNIEVVPLKFENSFADGLATLFSNWKILWREIGKANFVHTGCGGFPFLFSPCFLAHVIALLKQRARLFVMDCDIVGKLESDQIACSANWLKKAVWITYAELVWQTFKFCLSTTRASFLLGRGVLTRYGRYAKNKLEIYQPIIGQEDLIDNDQLTRKLEEINEDQGIKAVYVGRLAYEKGIDIFLNALAILAKLGITLEADIIGSGQEEKRLKELSVELQLKKIKFVGELEWGEQIFSYLRKSHLFIVAHRTEEMTRSIFEGLASGCALICADTLAMKQLVAQSNGGVVFEKGNPESLAHVLIRLFLERNTLKNLIKNGFHFCKTNHRDAHIQKRINFLMKIFPDLQWR